MVLATTSVVASGVYVAGCTKSEYADVPEIMLEAANSSGASPWMSSVSSPDAPSAVPSSASVLTGEADTTHTLSGAEVGLYGGTPNSSVCDRQKMDLFLDQNPDKATAFREVTHAPDIGDFLGGLSPVVLTADTRVTNHGFDNGVTTFQSVLQKGTTVLVNNTGEPVVRCACGNPLAAPAALSAPVSQLRFQGDKWEDWDIKRLAAVRPAKEPIKTFVLSNVAAAQDLPPNAPPPPPLAIDPGQPVPFVATPEVIEQARQTLRADQAKSDDSSVSNGDTVTDDQVTDTTGTDESSSVKESTENTSGVTDTPSTETEQSSVTDESGSSAVSPALAPASDSESPVPDSESPASESEPPSSESSQPVVGTAPAELPTELPPVTDYLPQLPSIPALPTIPNLLPTSELPVAP